MLSVDHRATTNTSLIILGLCVCSFIATSVTSQQYNNQGKEYTLIKELKTFNEAVTLCKSSGEGLVEIRSSAEQEFVFETIIQPTGYFIWLGATSKPGTTNFTWLSDGSDVNNHYTNWDYEFPYENVSQSNAIIMSNYDGKWIDFSVSDPGYVLCERNNLYPTQTTQSTQSTPSTPVSWQQYSLNGKAYFFIKEQKTYDEAVALCMSSGQSLVSIKSKAENELIWTTIVRAADYSTWLGATNILGTNNFTWLADGSDVSTQYTNWYSSETSEDVHQRNAIWMSSEDGKWYDYSVSSTRYVLCEVVSLATLQSSLLEQSNLSNAKIKEQHDLISELKQTIEIQNKVVDNRLTTIQSITIALTTLIIIIIIMLMIVIFYLKKVNIQCAG